MSAVEYPPSVVTTCVAPRLLFLERADYGCVWMLRSLSGRSARMNIADREQALVKRDCNQIIFKRVAGFQRTVVAERVEARPCEALRNVEIHAAIRSFGMEEWPLCARVTRVKHQGKAEAFNYLRNRHIVSR